MNTEKQNHEKQIDQPFDQKSKINAPGSNQPNPSSGQGGSQNTTVNRPGALDRESDSSFERDHGAVEGDADAELNQPTPRADRDAEEETDVTDRQRRSA